MSARSQTVVSWGEWEDKANRKCGKEKHETDQLNSTPFAVSATAADSLLHLVVLGHPDFPRFGLSARLAEQLKAPCSGPAFMAIELVPGALASITGEVRYPPPFGLEKS